MKALDRTLAAWAKEYRAQLDPSIVKLIEGAKQDLHFGPAYGEESDFPGFETACLAIKSALEDVPSTLYVDTDAEVWQESEPSAYECPECVGNGVPTDDDCPGCAGSGKVEPYLEETYQVERRDLVRALVGKELAEYV